MNNADHIGDFLKTTRLGDGRLVVVYLNETQGALQVGIEKSSGSRDFSTTLLRGEGRNLIGYYNDVVAVGSEIHIVTHDKTDGTVLYFHGDGGGNFGKPQLVDSGLNKDQKKRRVGRYASIDVDAQGDKHISYYDETIGDLYYAAQSKTAQEWRVARVAASDDLGRGLDRDDLGQFAVIAAAKNNTLYIAFQDATMADLYLAIGKSAADGSRRWEFKPVDTEGEVGSWLDMALDSKGHPVISYYDSRHGDLKLARPFENSVKVVDSTSNVGIDSSLKLDASDRAHISYLDANGFDLRYAVEMGDKFDCQTLDRQGIAGFFSSLQLNDTRGDDYTILYHLSYNNDVYNSQRLEQKVLIWPPNEGGRS